jgi:hypothetical protein
MRSAVVRGYGRITYVRGGDGVVWYGVAMLGRYWECGFGVFWFFGLVFGFVLGVGMGTAIFLLCCMYIYIYLL